MQKTPNRNRWEGWVLFAWAIVALTALGSLIIIGTLGQVEVPTVDRFGNRSWETQANPMVWALGIGQTVAAAMLAALFSMVNSIYQNSCDQLELATDIHGHDLESSAASVDAGNVESGEYALRITRIEERSPLFDRAYVGYLILKVNGKHVDSIRQLESLIVDGDNVLEMLTNRDEEITLTLPMNTVDSVRFTAEVEKLPVDPEPPNLPDGLKVIGVHPASPLHGVIHPDYTLLRINGKNVTSELVAAGSVVDGDNIVEMVDKRGQYVKKMLPMKPGPLHIKFAT